MHRRFHLYMIVVALLVSALSFSASAAEPKIKMADAIEFRAFSEYKEAPLFSSGAFPMDEIPYLKGKTLEPVKERLPKTPKVIKLAAMPDGIGEYGGVWRDFSGYPPVSYNWGSGLSTGAFGLDDWFFEPLLADYMATFLEEGMAPEPNLVESWKWSDDGKTLTVHLLEGVRWSDGVEFTVDDILFTYYDVYRDNKVPVTNASWSVSGEYAELEKIDKYTLAVHLPKQTNQVFYGMMKTFPLAKHAFMDYHPKYNKDATYEDFKNAFMVPSVPVVLGPYIPYLYRTDEIAELIRNPYYFKVDEDGKQLPYIDKIQYIFGKESSQSTLQLMAGNIDWANMDDPSQFPTWMANRARGKYEVLIPDPHQLFTLRLNYMLWEESMSDPKRDYELRKVFRNLKFRQALSHAIDREKIMGLFAPRPVLEPAPVAGVSLSSEYYDPKVQVRYEYDEAQAKALLDEIGLVDTNGDGLRDYPASSPLAGQTFTFTILASSDANDMRNIAELVTRELQKIGLDAQLRIQNPNLIASRTDAGDYDITTDRGVQGADPLANLDSLAPITQTSPQWHMASPDGDRELMPFEEDLRELVYQLESAVTFPEQKALMDQIHNIYTENVYCLGIIARRKAHAAATRFRNVHSSAAKMLWDDRQYTIPWTVWIPKELQ